MTRVVLANELGGGWGHLIPLRAIADEFILRGCKVTLICRDYEKAVSVFAGMNVAFEQSPAWTVCKTGFSLNYAQNLWGNGYWDLETFGIHFKWWSDRFKALKPRFVLTDYAPTALLSAMSLDIPRGAFGTGFTLPPMATPMPCLHPWLEVPGEALSRSEKTVLDAIRKLAPSVTSISGIFQGAHRFLEIFPELDHFEFRPSEKHIGPVFESPGDRELIWPDGSGCKIFIYLSSANRCLDDLIDHIKKLGVPALGIIRGLQESDRKAMASSTLRLNHSLVDLHRAASECEIAVTQGGLHTSARMLLSGVRLLICPEQLEQALFAYQLQKRGLCKFVSFFSEANKVAEVFDQVANSMELGKNVTDFASKYARYDSALTVKKIVQTCIKAA